MNPRLFFGTLSLVAVLAISSCTSAKTSAPALPTAESLESLPATATLVASSPVPQAPLVPTQTANIQVVPTSRGPNLEATDPTTVALASGQLQLVEFFRFT